MRKVIDTRTGQIFKCAKDYARLHGIAYTSLMAYLTGERIQRAFDCMFIDEQDYDCIELDRPIMKIVNKKTNKTYDTIADAEIDTGYRRGKLLEDVLSGKNKDWYIEDLWGKR